jgi:hypothetical protein
MLGDVTGYPDNDKFSEVIVFRIVVTRGTSNQLSQVMLGVTLDYKVCTREQEGMYSITVAIQGAENEI